jgi:hypothetical protein
MYLQKVISKKTLKKNFFVGILSATDEKAGSGLVSQWYGSPDMDPWIRIRRVPKCHGSTTLPVINGHNKKSVFWSWISINQRIRIKRSQNMAVATKIKPRNIIRTLKSSMRGRWGEKGCIFRNTSKLLAALKGNFSASLNVI